MSNSIANYGILDIENDKIKFENLNIKYDVREVIQEIEKLKFPFYKGILKIFYGIK